MTERKRKKAIIADEWLETLLLVLEFRHLNLGSKTAIVHEICCDIL